MSKAVSTALILGLLSIFVLAPRSVADPAPPESAQPHAVAEQLCRLLYTPARYEASLDQGSALLIDNLARTGHPVPADKRAAVRKAVGETASYQEMVNQTATLFAGSFSLPELHDLLHFYQSRTGQRSLQLPQLLDRSGADLGQLIAGRISPKLRALGLSLPDGKEPK